MCEHCARRERRLRKLDRAEREGAYCEWFEEEQAAGAGHVGEPDEDQPPEMCALPATHAVSQWIVTEHVCSKHVARYKAELERGLADFLDAAGLSSEVEFLPITQTETCDYLDPLTGETCRETASHAQFVLEDSILCASHAERMMKGG